VHQTGGMAQVAIIVNGTASAGKAEISRALGILLGCPVLDPAPLLLALKQQTGPVAPAAGIRALAVETVWRTAGLVDAGVIVDGAFEPGDREEVQRGFELAGSPRVVEVWCGDAGEALALTPVVAVESVDTVDMDALVQRISALFV
jgi:hypothetical protein